MTAWLEFGLSNALAATLLAAAAFVATRLARRPQWAFALWMLVLAKLLVPPILGLPLPSLRPPAPARDPSAAIAWDSAEFAFDSVSPQMGEVGNWDAAANEVDAAHLHVAAEPEVKRLSISPTTAIVVIWLGVAALWLAVAVTRTVRFARVLSRAEPAPDDLQRETELLAARLGVRGVPRVKLVRRRMSPLVWALFGEPVILLPAGLVRILSHEQRATLLTHELVHLQRRDHLARLVELAAIALYWWHPVAWWARRNAERAAEQCCDAEVLARWPGAARAYAEALITTVDFLSDAPRPLPLGASGFSQGAHVKRRIEMILEARPVRRSIRPVRLVLLAAGLAALPLSLRALWAEPAEPADKPAVESTREAPDATSGKTNDALEERLTRLEKMIESLAGKLPDAPPAGKPPSQTAEARQSASHDLSREMELSRELADLVGKTTLESELAKAKHSRKQAAAQQVEALKAAFEKGSATIDELLEAQRRLAEAETSHLRANCDYLFAAANLHVANRALNNARQTWQQVRTLSGSESRAELQAEAQAREQFYQFKSQTQTLYTELHKAETRLRYTRGLPPAQNR